MPFNLQDIMDNVTELFNTPENQSTNASEDIIEGAIENSFEEVETVEASMQFPASIDVVHQFHINIDQTDPNAVETVKQFLEQAKAIPIEESLLDYNNSAVHDLNSSGLKLVKETGTWWNPFDNGGNLSIEPMQESDIVLYNFREILQDQGSVEFIDWTDSSGTDYTVMISSENPTTIDTIRNLPGVSSFQAGPKGIDIIYNPHNA